MPFWNKSAEVSEEAVLDSMRHIIDPDLGKDIVSLGFVKNLVIKGGAVSFTLELTTPACPVKETFKKDAETAVGKIPGVEKVAVSLSAMEPKKRAGNDINTLTTVDTIIAVSSCKGGVGKSTVAAHIARQLQREGFLVGLLDTDIYGPSIPTLFNTHRPEVYMRNNLINPVEIDGLKVMSLGFIMDDAPAVVRGPIVSSYTQQLLKQTNWGKLDYLIIDMPPGTGDIQLTLVQQAALDGAVIVTTPQALSLVDVSRGILMFEKVDVPVLGLVENMCYFDCGDCGARHYPFGSNAQSLKDRFGLQTLAELPIIPGISNMADRHAGADLPVLKQLTENLHRAVGMSRAQEQARPDVTPGQGEIVVSWPDGSVDRLANKAVRTACQCALCVHEYTGEQLLDPAAVPADIQVRGVTPLGNYAVSIAWGDGHSSGIYTWDHLRALAGRK